MNQFISCYNRYAKQIWCAKKSCPTLVVEINCGVEMVILKFST
jgi:hypothetical protein